MDTSLAIVVPLYNEEATIEDLYGRIARLGLAESLLLVDNGSTDGTRERLEGCSGARVIRHDTNRGYGGAIRSAIQASSASRLVIIDGDLEYPPEAIPDLLAALDRHSVVYGSRLLSGAATGLPFARRIGNATISAIFNVLFGQRTTDLYTGMKALRREAVDRLALQQDGFEHVLEMSVQLASLGYRIREVPVAYAPRTRGVSKMRHLPETLKFTWYILRYWIRFTVLRRPVRAEAL